MNGPLYYKAFIKRFNKITDVVSINLFAKEIYVSNYVDAKKNTFGFDEIELLRGTGLTDQFRNEIFAGHKIKAINIHTGDVALYEVCDLPGAICFSKIDSETYLLYDDLAEIEIVGWIYFDQSESVWDTLKKIAGGTVEIKTRKVKCE